MKHGLRTLMPLALMVLFSATFFSTSSPAPLNQLLQHDIKSQVVADDITVAFTLLNDDQTIDLAVLPSAGYITEPTVIQRTNAEIHGWFLENTLSTEFDFTTTVVTASMDLFAQWEHIGNNDKATLTQSSEGTTFINGEVTLSLQLYLTDTVTYQWEYKRDENDSWGTIVGATESSYVPDVNGYHGYRCVYRYVVNEGGVPDEKRRESEGVWLTLSGGVDWTPISLVASAVLLIALAIFLTYPTPIVYDTNGGHPITPAKAKAFSDITLQPTPVKEGYIFDGWFLDKELTKPFNLVRASRKKIRLYARWIKQ